MSAAERAQPVSAAEANALFSFFENVPAVILAISGGPDSTALLWLAARWRARRKKGPKLIAVSVDHGLRPGSRREATAVKRLARELGVTHRTLRWTGAKPATGIQAAAREARYRLLARAARQARTWWVATAHTLDDQAETVLFRLARGSGIKGLVAMGKSDFMPLADMRDVNLHRPFLDLPKSRLIATLARAGVDFAEDPSNSDPRFTRARLRALMPALAREGLTAERLALFARRAGRAEATLNRAAFEARAQLAPGPWPPGAPIVVEADPFLSLPPESSLRLLGMMIEAVGDEGPVELGKLEALHDALMLRDFTDRFRRTLAGAMVTLANWELTVERAPPRGRRPAPRGGPRGS